MIKAQSILIACAFLVTGCSQTPITSNEIDLKLTIDSIKDLIPGDKVVPELDLVASDEVRERINTKIEFKHEEETLWSEATSVIEFDKSGKWSVRAYAFENESSDTPIVYTEELDFTVHDLEALVSDLFYGLTNSWLNSPEEGIKFTEEKNYPGLFLTDTRAAKTARSDLIKYGFWQRVVPDLSTLRPDNSWYMSPDDTTCFTHTPDGPLEGRTFILTLETHWGESETGYESYPSKSMSHVTLLDGNLYMYSPLC